MNTLPRWLLMIGLAILAYPDLGLAQEPVGVVTTLSGQATRTASAAGEAPAPLRFKDGIFGADTIRTAERSFVRMLLERKAVLTVRELSVLRITEDATQATVDLKAGGIAFSVARPRLRPGETVLVRTPNAVAAVRGTTIVVETQGAVTHFHVLTGALDVASHANPTAWQRLQAPMLARRAMLLTQRNTADFTPCPTAPPAARTCTAPTATSSRNWSTPTPSPA